MHTLVKDVTEKTSTTHTVVGGDINTRYVVTSYDTDADGVNDQVDGTESWYSSEFSALSFSLSVQSDNAISTVSPLSTYDKWLLKDQNGDSSVYYEGINRANDWNYENKKYFNINYFRCYSWPIFLLFFSGMVHFVWRSYSRNNSFFYWRKKCQLIFY